MDSKKNTFDPVDHENKEIHSPEDYVQHDNLHEPKSEERSDIMKEDAKQVSSEIDRPNLAEELKDKGC